MSAWHALVHNGRMQSHDPGQASTFLRHKPPGAYTTSRTILNASCLIFWERHLARLCQSIHLLTGNAPPTTQNSMLDLINSSLCVGLEKAMDVRNNGSEFMITVLAIQPQNLTDIYVHIASANPLPVASANVAVMGPSRESPLIKCSQWATTREVLEQCKPQNVDEVILSNDGNNLLEGLVTNFFVVVRLDEEDDYSSEFAVQTASLEDGVLPGIVRQVIFEICKEKGIPVLETSPLWEKRHKWSEAFITSSVRLIQPVNSIQMPVPWNTHFNSILWKESNWDYHQLPLSQEKESITAMLQGEVLKRGKKYGYFPFQCTELS